MEENDEIEDDYVNDPEMDKNIDNYIRRIPEPDEPESFEDPLSPLVQIAKVKADYRKSHPSVDVIIKRAVKNRNSI